MYWKVNSFNLVRGNDDSILIFLVETDANGNMSPINVSGCTGILFRFKNQDGSILEKSPTTGMSVGVCQTLSCYPVDLTAAEISNLKLGQSPIEVKMSFGEKTHSYQISKAVCVADIGF